MLLKMIKIKNKLVYIYYIYNFGKNNSYEQYKHYSRTATDHRKS